FMLQVDSMDDVGLAHDRAGRLGVRLPILWAAIRTTTCFPSMPIRRADSRSSSAGAGAQSMKIGPSVDTSNKAFGVTSLPRPGQTRAGSVRMTVLALLRRDPDNVHIAAYDLRTAVHADFVTEASRR